MTNPINPMRTALVNEALDTSSLSDHLSQLCHDFDLDPYMQARMLVALAKINDKLDGMAQAIYNAVPESKLSRPAGEQSPGEQADAPQVVPASS